METIVPIGVCVVLPVMVAWLLMRTRINYDNKRAEVLMEAIRSSNCLDAEKLTESLTRPKVTDCQRMERYLLRACIWGLIGVACLIIAVIGGCSNSWDSDDFTVPGLFGAISLAVGIAYIIVYSVYHRRHN